MSNSGFHGMANQSRVQNAAARLFARKLLQHVGQGGWRQVDAGPTRVVAAQGDMFDLGVCYSASPHNLGQVATPDSTDAVSRMDCEGWRHRNMWHVHTPPSSARVRYLCFLLLCFKVGVRLPWVLAAWAFVFVYSAARGNLWAVFRARRGNWHRHFFWQQPHVGVRRRGR